MGPNTDLTLLLCHRTHDDDSRESSGEEFQSYVVLFRMGTGTTLTCKALDMTHTYYIKSSILAVFAFGFESPSTT